MENSEKTQANFGKLFSGRLKFIGICIVNSVNLRICNKYTMPLFNVRCTLQCSAHSLPFPRVKGEGTYLSKHRFCRNMVVYAQVILKQNKERLFRWVSLRRFIHDNMMKNKKVLMCILCNFMLIFHVVVYSYVLPSKLGKIVDIQDYWYEHIPT